MPKTPKDLFYIALGKKIAESRNLANLTQQKLAGMLDLSRASIVNIEKGRQQLSIFLLCKVAFHLKTSIDKLIPHIYDQLTDDVIKSEIEKELGNDPKAQKTFKKFMSEIKTS